MRGFAPQLEQIQLLVDKTQHHMIYSANLHPHDCEKLLSLSTQIDYSYGKAVAQVHLAQYAQMTMDTERYYTHLDKSRTIALQKGYFDVVIKCEQLEGRHNSGLCDEMAALSHYLKGLTLATETKDQMYCFLFYREIAMLFSDCGAYEDAAFFYQKALSILSEHYVPNEDFYRKETQVYLLRLTCIQGNLEQAEATWKACHDLPGEPGTLPMLLLVEEIRLLLLRGDQKTATMRAQSLLHALGQDTRDPILLQSVYLCGTELLLALEWQEATTWCLSQIELYYPNLSRKNAIRLQDMRLQYAHIFGLADDGAYQDFYQVAQHGQMANCASTAAIFRSLVARYETAKEQNQMMEELTDLQIAIDRDELTNLYNRRYYSKLISKHLQDHRLSSLSCIMVDVDFFKEYNDFYGHLKGDQALIEIASLLHACLPDGCFAARYGGDEFSCLLINQPEEMCITFATRVKHELQAKQIPHIHCPKENYLTLSLGIYRATDLVHCDEAQLLRQADQALYQAKEQGRNTYVMHTQGREIEWID